MGLVMGGGEEGRRVGENMVVSHHESRLDLGSNWMTLVCMGVAVEGAEGRYHSGTEESDD